MMKIFQSIFKHLPFKREIFQILRKIWKPQKRIYRHLHFKGVINVPIAEGSSFKIMHHGYQIENSIFWEGLTGNWERESLALWIRLCKDADVVLDIGANTGVYALIAQAINPDANVYAFEPVKRVFEKLQRNIKLNDYKITAIEKAVSNANGTAVIYDKNTEHIYSVTVNKNLDDTGEEFVESEIQTVKLDTFVTQYDIKKIDLVKIDVETHEPEVLEGFLNYLKIFKPTFLIEILNDDVAERLNLLLAGNEYIYFSINEKTGLKRVSSLREGIKEGQDLNYLVCSNEKGRSLGLIK